MNNESFEEILKAKIDEIKEKTLTQLLSQDNEYRHACQQQGLAENNYLHLNLTDEQKAIIDNLLSWTDVSNVEYSSLSYLAGLFDSQKLFEMFNTKASRVSQKNQFIRNFYNGILVPIEEPFESETAKNLWREVSKMEESIISIIPAEQLNSFQQLTEKQSERLSQNIEDSFYFGFQLGAKFLIDVLC